MFCQYCGTPLPESARFCPQCGKPCPPPPAEAPVQPVVEAQPPVEAQPQPAVKPAKAKRPGLLKKPPASPPAGGRNRRALLIGGLALALVLAVGLVLFLRWFLPHEGTITYSDGSVYTGGIRQGEPHGYGRMDYALSSSAPVPGRAGEDASSIVYYEGEWSTGIKCGDGIQEWSDGSRYEGEWDFDRQTGVGCQYYCEEDEREYYDGTWSLGSKTGPGLLAYKSGVSVKGTWEDGALYGEGLYTFADGTLLIGTFEDSRFQGDAIQKEQSSGYWHRIFEDNESIFDEHITDKGALVAYETAFQTWDSAGFSLIPELAFIDDLFGGGQETGAGGDDDGDDDGNDNGGGPAESEEGPSSGGTGTAFQSPLSYWALSENDLAENYQRDGYSLQSVNIELVGTDYLEEYIDELTSGGAFKLTDFKEQDYRDSQASYFGTYFLSYQGEEAMGSYTYWTGQSGQIVISLGNHYDEGRTMLSWYWVDGLQAEDQGLRASQLPEPLGGGSSGGTSGGGSSSGGGVAPVTGDDGNEVTIRCSKCHGTGSIACTNCGGLGYKETTVGAPNYSGNLSGPSYGTSKQTCYKCHGSGSITCTRCGGSGRN